MRTSISIVGFGLAAARLGQAQNVIWSEILLLVAGAAVVFIAYMRMRKLKSQIASSAEIDDVSTATDTLLLLLIAALFGLLALFGMHVSKTIK